MIKPPYAEISNQELLLRCFLTWTMICQVPFVKRRSGIKASPVMLAEVLLAIIEKLGNLRFKPIRNLMSILFKRTAMRVFFGGETLSEAMQRCKQLLRKGIGVIVDYSAPENVSSLTPEHFSKVVPATYRETIDKCAEIQVKFPNQTVAVAIKPSTLEAYDKLISLCHELKNPKDRRADFRTRYNDLSNRFQGIVKHAQIKHVRVYVDAELTEINPLIRQLCYDSSDKKIPVTMTIQAYLKESPKVVKEVLQRNNKPGIKLVRGAYMGPAYAAERPLIWKTKEQTDKCYNQNLEKLFGKVPVLTIATHNQESINRCSKLIKSNKSNYSVELATLLGMGDGLEVDEGISLLKYVPYPGKGSILGALAYMGRRGTEFARNPVENGIMRGEQELMWLKHELKKRTFGEKLEALLTFPKTILFNKNMLLPQRSNS